MSNCESRTEVNISPSLQKHIPCDLGYTATEPLTRPTYRQFLLYTRLVTVDLSGVKKCCRRTFLDR